MNRLARELSPYLQQHGANPVWWWPWCPEAFEQAQREQKPIFLSIGYATCYWCHVMEKDSFEQEDVAEILNREYIAIKVDREERPDVDAIYMDAVVGFTGHGGWPMSVFLTPEAKPFWGGTFFYREQFKRILGALADAWRTDRTKIEETGAEVVRLLRQSRGDSNASIDRSGVLSQAIDQYRKSYDTRDGGFGGAPKFPPSLQLEFLISESFRRDDSALLSIVDHTLVRMARGGIYDQLGGGFHRYAVDGAWAVPHFEKMLYDNALLVSCYLKAFLHTANPGFLAVVRETVDYLMREMQSPEGAFYCAQDAGEVGDEGAYYVWKCSELEASLSPEELMLARTVFGATPEGNFEHQRNVLQLAAGWRWSDRDDPRVVALREKLLNLRAARQAPLRDDKLLTSWNGLAIRALAEAGWHLGDERYVQASARAAQCIKSHFWNGTELLRRGRVVNGELQVGISACLDDYAYLIHGLFALYRATTDRSWLDFARELQRVQDAELWDSATGEYRYSRGTGLIVDRRELHDGAIPSAAAIALRNLGTLSALFPSEEWSTRSDQLWSRYAGVLTRQPLACPSVLSLLSMQELGARSVVLAPGDDRNGIDALLRRSYLPQVEGWAYAGNDCELGRGRCSQNGYTTVYVCQHGACELPAVDESALRRALGGR